MATEKVSFKMTGSYNGHNVKNNGNVDIRFKFPYAELVNTTQLLQCFSQNINVAVKVGLEKPFKLGLFNVNKLAYDRDGEALVILNSETDYVEMDRINDLVTKELITVRCDVKIEVEEDEENE